jgi:hypothetical protein
VDGACGWWLVGALLCWSAGAWVKIFGGNITKTASKLKNHNLPKALFTPQNVKVILLQAHICAHFAQSADIRCARHK